MKKEDKIIEDVLSEDQRSFWQEVRRPIVILLCIIVGFVAFRLVVVDGTMFDQSFKPNWDGDSDLFDAKKAVQAADFQKATMILNKLLAKEPNYGAAHALLGYVYLQQDRLKEALEHYKKAALYEPSEGRIQNAINLIRSRQEQGGDNKNGDQGLVP